MLKAVPAICLPEGGGGRTVEEQKEDSAWDNARSESDPHKSDPILELSMVAPDMVKGAGACVNCVGEMPNPSR